MQKCKNTKRGLKLSENQTRKGLQNGLQMQTKCKGFSAKNCLFLHNVLNVGIMQYILNLREKRLFCARFARFFAQNTRFAHLFARYLHKYEKLVFAAFPAFLPLNPPLFCFNPAIFHILPTTLMQGKMQNRCK